MPEVGFSLFVSSSVKEQLSPKGFVVMKGVVEREVLFLCNSFELAKPGDR